MKIKFLILYSWLVRVSTYFLPEIPAVQSFRGWLYSLAMAKCGARFRVSFSVVINHLEKINVGRNSYIACGSVLTGGGEIYIGDDVLIGPNVIVSSNNHVFNGVNFLHGYKNGVVIIGNGCWIGGNSSILLGTHIHDSSLVGAGSVCNKNFGIGSVLIAGFPAKVIGILKPEASSHK